MRPLCFSIACVFALCLALSGICLANNNHDADKSLPMKAVFQAGLPTTGDMVVLHLEFTLPHKARLADPFAIDGIEQEQIISAKPTQKGIDLTLLVDSLDIFSVEELSLGYIADNGKTGWFKSEPVQIKVNNGLPDDPSKLSPRPIKGIIPAKPVWIRYLAWSLGIAVIIAAISAVVWFILKKRQQEVLGPPPVLPHVVALKEIDALREKWEDSKDGDKAGYFRLSMIIRSYMGRIRSFPAAEFTTEEISAKASEDCDRDILKVLKKADMIKFAKVRTAIASREHHLDKARDYVVRTTPVVEDEVI